MKFCEVKLPCESVNVAETGLNVTTDELLPLLDLFWDFVYLDISSITGSHDDSFFEWITVILDCEYPYKDVSKQIDNMKKTLFFIIVILSNLAILNKDLC